MPPILPSTLFQRFRSLPPFAFAWAVPLLDAPPGLMPPPVVVRSPLHGCCAAPPSSTALLPDLQTFAES